LTPISQLILQDRSLQLIRLLYQVEQAAIPTAVHRELAQTDPLPL